MAALGADVQFTSNELVGLIEALKDKRAAVDRVIRAEEEERVGVVDDMQQLAERLRSLDNSLAQNVAMRTEFDRAIAENTAQFSRILESSRMLLSTVKQDSASLHIQQQRSNSRSASQSQLGGSPLRSRVVGDTTTTNTTTESVRLSPRSMAPVSPYNRSAKY